MRNKAQKVISPEKESALKNSLSNFPFLVINQKFEESYTIKLYNQGRFYLRLL